jgi:hypothetical protein
MKREGVMNFRVWVILSVVAISGCATQGVNTFNFNDAKPAKIDNEIVVSKSQSVVWDILVKQLSKSFYIINNIDKASRIICKIRSTSNTKSGKDRTLNPVIAEQ